LGIVDEVEEGALAVDREEALGIISILMRIWTQMLIHKMEGIPI
jgi:hypothetical protein